METDVNAKNASQLCSSVERLRETLMIKFHIKNLAIIFREFNGVPEIRVIRIKFKLSNLKSELPFIFVE